MLLGGRLSRADRRRDAPMLGSAQIWEALAAQEDLALASAGAATVAQTLDKHPWLQVCRQVAREQGFFHSQLDFAPVFARGGFPTCRSGIRRGCGPSSTWMPYSPRAIRGGS